MGKASNIVHQYFKKEVEGSTILVRLNPIQLKVTEITLFKDAQPELREMDVDPVILDDLQADGFVEASALEFNLYLSGLAG